MQALNAIASMIGLMIMGALVVGGAYLVLRACLRKDA